MIKFLLLSLTISLTFIQVRGQQIKNSISISFDAKKIEKNARLINLILNKNENIITLDNTRLIEDDAPAVGLPEKYFGKEYRKATAPWQEDLKKGIVIKKILMLDHPSAWSGRLLFFGEEVQGNKDPLYISVNGYRLIRPASLICCPHARQYIDIEWLRWYFVDLPIGALKKGANEILFWTESEQPSWKICIALEEEFSRGSLTRLHHPNRSFKSSDGGKTWRDSELGINNSEDGEYDIRFSLDRYVPSGQYISTVMDLTDDQAILKRRIDSLITDLFVDMEIPDNTRASVMVRFSKSPLLSDPDWSAWEKVPIGKKITKQLDTKRYFQWKVEMTTADPLQSPAIHGISISSKWQGHSPNAKMGLAATVIQNGKVITPSYIFKYEDLGNPELRKFREKFKLDKIVEGASSEFEIMMRLLHWSYRIPVQENAYSWNANDIAVYRKKDKKMPPPEVVQSGDIRDWMLMEPDDQNMPQLQWNYNRRRRDAQCNFSNLALQGALMAMGYQARYININSEGTSGHEITEVWSNEFNKWIYLDATRDYYYFDTKTGIPLNLLEIHNLLAEEIPTADTWQRPFSFTLGKEISQKIQIGFREGYNAFSIEKDARHVLPWMGYFRIPLRNNFYSQPLPIPVAQGFTMWGWNGYLNHYDDKFPKRTEFQRQSNRFTDFYEPLNQSRVFLAETSEPGVLKVEVQTHTPGFMTFQIRINDGNWIDQKNAEWLWSLKAGMNKIEIRTKTQQGITGPPSCLKVTFNP